MSKRHGTAIEWTHIPGFKGETWNPIVGCSVVSPGCTNCYAMRTAARIAAMGVDHYSNLVAQTKAGPVWNGDTAIAPRKTFLKPWFWKKPRAIFVNSMGDLFHEGIDDELIDRVFAVMALCSQHTFMVLTKRASRMRDYMRAPWRKRSIAAASIEVSHLIASERGTFKARPRIEHFEECFAGNGPFPNIWLGVSVEDQRRAEERVPDLLHTPAAKRFISCEPLLGPVDLRAIDVNGDGEMDALFADRWSSAIESWRGTDDDWEEGFEDWFGRHPDEVNPDAPMYTPVDWVIVGGESGANARPMHPYWAQSIRDQCEGTGTAFFFKQWGEWAPGMNCPPMEGIRPCAKWFANSWMLDDCRMHDPEDHWQDPPDVFRIGKRLAGNKLDGVEHQYWPEVSS